MSRSGYSDDCDEYDQWAAIRWHGAVKSAIRGKRGQQLLKDILAAMDAMPEKRLVRNVLVFDGSGDPIPPRADPMGYNSYYGDLVIVGGDELYDKHGNTCNVGDCCAMGSLVKARGLDVSNIDPEDSEAVAALFKVNDKLVREIAYWNDEGGIANEKPEERWQRMRKWVERQIMRDIFVFGSNLAGRHGKGAARTARYTYGAKYGEGVGRTGDAYAIPTRDERLKTLPLDRIKPYVDDFLAYAREHPELTFEVTAVGCGLAGYSFDKMAPMFRGAPPNCRMPGVWKHYLGQA